MKQQRNTCVHCKKGFAKFRCGQRWREPNDVGVGKFLLPRHLVLRHRYQHRNLAHSDMAFLQCIYSYSTVCTVIGNQPVVVSEFWLRNIVSLLLSFIVLFALNSYNTVIGEKGYLLLFLNCARTTVICTYLSIFLSLSLFSLFFYLFLSLV
jgi:hypothetical protein